MWLKTLLSINAGKQTTGCGQKCKGDDKENGDSKTKSKLYSYVKSA